MMFRCAITYIMMFRCATQGHDLQADVPRGGLRRQFAVPVLRRHVEVSHIRVEKPSQQGL